jgi:FdhE protein
VLIEATNETRTLRCSYCALGWSLHTRRCIYCGNEGDGFVAAAPDVNRPQQRVELCSVCSSYTKVVETTEPTPFPLLAIDDLATMHLDRGAMDRGYQRPPMIDLNSIEPRKSVC